MSKVVSLSGKQFAGDGEPPDNAGMDARVAKLEDFAQQAGEKLVRIETKLESIEGSMATKAELHDMTAQMVKWIIGTAIGLGVAGITVMTFVLNNATPKAQPAAQPPAVIINVPGAPSAAAKP